MATRVHRAEARTVVIGVVAVGVLLLIGWVGAIVQGGGALPGRTYTYISADFSDIGTLGEGKEVRIDGVRVGQVSGVRYVDGGTARVDMRLEGDYEVREDATAAVQNVSALGKKFVELDLGDESKGLLGDRVIAVASTQASTSLEDILADLDKPTLKALRGALGELSNGVGGHSSDLSDLLRVAPDLLTDLETVAGSLTSPKADLEGVLTSADTLVSRFEGREDELRGLLVDAGTTLEAVGVDDGKPLEDTLANLPSAMKAARRGLDAVNRPLTDVRSTVSEVRPGAGALGDATPDLRHFLTSSVPTLEQVPGVAEQADPALADLTRTIADARPLVGRVRTGVASLAAILDPLSPYADDIGRFFSQHDLLSGTLQGTDDKHYFAALVTAPGLYSVAGLPDPIHRSEAYPKPRTAWNHKTKTDARGDER